MGSQSMGEKLRGRVQKRSLEPNTIEGVGTFIYSVSTHRYLFLLRNTSNLYKKILSADYQIPKFVSSECADLLTKILNTNPDTRYSIDDIRAHPWFKL